MISLIYDTGTATVSNGSAVVTGTETGWATAKVAGGIFSCLGRSIPIASVESETSLTLAYEWPGPAFTGAYAIARSGSEASDSVFAYQTLTEVLRKAFLAVVPPDGVGTLTERDALDPVPDVGYIWLRWEDGEDLEYYFKEESGWDGPFAVKGDTGSAGSVGALGDLSDVSITSATAGDVLRYDGAWINHDASGWTSVSVVSNEATIDIDDGDKFLVTVDDDCELQVPANAVAGAPFAIRVVMDGSHAFTFATGWLGEPPSVLTATGDETVLSGIVLDTGPTTAIINLVKSIPA